MSSLHKNVTGSAKGDEVRGIILFFLIACKGSDVMADKKALSIRRVTSSATVPVALSNLYAYFLPTRAAEVFRFSMFPRSMTVSAVRLAIGWIKPHLASLLCRPFSFFGVFISFCLKSPNRVILRSSRLHSNQTLFSHLFKNFWLLIHPSVFVRHVFEFSKSTLFAKGFYQFTASAFTNRCPDFKTAIADNLKRSPYGNIGSTAFARSESVRCSPDLRHDPSEHYKRCLVPA